ncbi:hypothetical protein ACEOWJ_002753 [Bacillus cereus]
MQYYIPKCIDNNVSAYYNKGIKMKHILTTKRGGNHMAIAMAVLSFLGAVIPLVAELLKAVM